jgi:hypothetical protein
MKIFIKLLWILIILCLRIKIWKRSLIFTKWAISRTYLIHIWVNTLLSPWFFVFKIFWKLLRLFLFGLFII